MQRPARFRCPHNPDGASAMQSFRWLAVLLALAIGGCTTFPPVIDTGEGHSKEERWAMQQLTNQRLSGWRIKGKIGVKAGKKGGSATLRWTYRDTIQNIQMYGPFGNGRVIIDAAPGMAVLKDSEGRIIEGETAEEVLFERLGWHVPFDELIMWSRGLPNEGATDIEVDEAGLLKRLRQGIWEVEYLEYSSIDSFLLPKKLEIVSLPGTLETYDGDGNYLGDRLRLVVIVKRWRDMVEG